MRVRLEPQAEHHCEGLFEALQPPDVHTFLGTKPPVSVDAVRQRIIRQAKGPADGSGTRWLNWVAFADDTIAGYTQATITADGTATLAYVLTPSFWGRSIAFEACKLTLVTLAGMEGVRTVVADTELANTRSRALLTRLGFTLVRETDADAFYEGGDIRALVRRLK